MGDKADKRRHWRAGGDASIELPPEVVRLGSYYVSRRDDAKMVFIPEGPFIMGSVEDDIFAADNEKPQRQVTLSAYLIDVFPVTNAAYARFIEEKGYQHRDYWSEAGWQWKEELGAEAPLAWRQRGWNDPEQPMAGVSWYEADAYCHWAGKQLPTEAQWEKSARGSDGRRYPWGEEFPTRQLANFNDYVGRTTKVGSYPQGVSPLGCYDMSGNVNNWCRDWYWDGFYHYCAEHELNADPVLDDRLREELALQDSEAKCDRGGGFATGWFHHEALSCPARLAWHPGERNFWNGFRTVIELLPSTEGR